MKIFVDAPIKDSMTTSLQDPMDLSYKNAIYEEKM